MPIYEYNCNACDHRFELLVPMSASSVLPECPECRSADTRKLISVFVGRSSGSDGGAKNLAGSGGCGSCAATSCCGCSGGGH